MSLRICVREYEARLIKLACSDPPEGRSRWTLHLLADELVALDEIDFSTSGKLL